MCHYLGLASHLRVFPSNEIEKGALTMKLKVLKNVQDSIKWPVPPHELPVVTWETCEKPLTYVPPDLVLMKLHVPL